MGHLRLSNVSPVWQFATHQPHVDKRHKLCNGNKDENFLYSGHERKETKFNREKGKKNYYNINSKLFKEQKLISLGEWIWSIIVYVLFAANKLKKNTVIFNVTSEKWNEAEYTFFVFLSHSSSPII